MKEKLLISILGLIMLAAFISTPKALVNISIQVKDPSGNVLNGLTVPLNTVAYAYGYYADGNGAKAFAALTVYYDDGTGLKYKATLFEGIISSGETVVGQPYTMAEIGEYEFRWTCTNLASRSVTTQCMQERAQTRTRIYLITPEPTTLAGLAMTTLALGLFAAKKHLKMRLT
ncbi:MAG: hypothetical protein QXX08_04075 [Candidatus Bathyarchaeia archaeon]